MTASLRQGSRIVTLVLQVQSEVADDTCWVDVLGQFLRVFACAGFDLVPFAV